MDESGRSSEVLLVVRDINTVALRACQQVPEEQTLLKVALRLPEVGRQHMPVVSVITAVPGIHEDFNPREIALCAFSGTWLIVSRAKTKIRSGPSSDPYFHYEDSPPCQSRMLSSCLREMGMGTFPTCLPSP